MPHDGWPEGTKKEAMFPIADGEVSKTERARWHVVLDALRKGVDLIPTDEATAKYCGKTLHAAAHKSETKAEKAKKWSE
jgi:hypothetical protein